MSKIFFQKNEFFYKNLRNIDKIRDGIGDKIGLLLRGISMYVTTFVVAFIIDWLTACVIFAVGPLSCLTMSFMARVNFGCYYWREQ